MGLPSISGVFSVEEYQLLESRASFGDIKTNDIKRHQKTSNDIKRHQKTSTMSPDIRDSGFMPHIERICV